MKAGQASLNPLSLKSFAVIYRGPLNYDGFHVQEQADIYIVRIWRAKMQYGVGMPSITVRYHRFPFIAIIDFVPVAFLLLACACGPPAA